MTTSDVHHRAAAGSTGRLTTSVDQEANRPAEGSQPERSPQE
jgi:hypothetical protein